MPAYRYLLTDLLTDHPLATLPLTGVSFERRISRVGAFQATLNAPDPRTVDMAKLVHEHAGRAALWVYRNNQVWWGGILWTSQATQGERGAVNLSLQASTFDSYTHHRRLREDLTYLYVDQGIIIPSLWRHMQADPRGDIGVVAEDQPTGVVRERTYYGHERAYYGERIEELGDVIGGPEHTVDVYRDGSGNRVKRLRVANQLGVAQPRVVFQRAARAGGRVLEWSDTNNAVDTGTTFETRGGSLEGNVGEESVPLFSELLEADDLLARGWPLLDVTQDRTDVTDVATLNEYAEADRLQMAGADRTHGFTVQVAEDSSWNPNRIGDAVRIKAADLWHDSLDMTVRPVACKVTAPSGGTAEQIELVFGGDE